MNSQTRRSSTRRESRVPHSLLLNRPDAIPCSFEKETLALQKDTKALLDGMRAISSTQMKLSETIDTFYGAADRMSEGAIAANAYRRSAEELDALTTGSFVCGLWACGSWKLLLTKLGMCRTQPTGLRY